MSCRSQRRQCSSDVVSTVNKCTILGFSTRASNNKQFPTTSRDDRITIFLGGKSNMSEVWVLVRASSSSHINFYQRRSVQAS
jgi:hypothetical protein